MSVFILEECYHLEVDGPARLTDSTESLTSWIDDLSIHLLNLLKDGVINESSTKLLPFHLHLGTGLLDLEAHFSQ